MKSSKHQHPDYKRFGKMQRPSKALQWASYVTFVGIFALLLAERFSPLLINNSIVRLILYVFCASFGVTQLWKLLIGWITIKTTVYIVIVVGIICGARAFFCWGADWKTQIVIYENKQDQRQTVEFQMRGARFAFGYRKRIVLREKLMPFVDYYTSPVDTAKLNPLTWQRIDLRVNELRLPHFTELPSN